MKDKETSVFPDRGLNQYGMYLRDYFAGQAMNQMIKLQTDGCDVTKDELAKQCYEYADAMMTERNRKD